MNYVTREDETSGVTNDGADQYLSFKLGESIYAFAVAVTREITEVSSFTRIPHAPDWVRGLISLRGTIVPVLNIKKKLGIPATPETADTRVIILEVQVQTEVFVFGVLADAVLSVVEIPAEKLSPPPRYDTQAQASSIRGVAQVQDRFVLVLDVESVFLDRASAFELLAVSSEARATGGDDADGAAERESGSS